MSEVIIPYQLEGEKYMNLVRCESMRPTERRLNCIQFLVYNPDVVKVLTRSFGLDPESNWHDLWKSWLENGLDDIGMIVNRLEGENVESFKIEQFLICLL